MPESQEPTMNFESAFIALQEVITKLENSELPLEEALQLYEEGQRLSALCTSILEAAQLRVNTIAENNQAVDLPVAGEE
ncbi:MAG: exodeoxyribonuclease VII small subunit [Anaerolineaceae bacterium]